jgi:hypothetical protein
MRQSVVRAVIAVAMLSGVPAHGAISPGSASGTTPPGELFFTVWDATNQLTYTRDLGISIIDFLGSPNTPISRAPDALYTSTFSGVDPSTLRYSVGAFNARFDDFPAAYGMVITSNSAADLVKVTDFTALFSTLQVAESYIVGANGKDGGNPTDYASNRSGISRPGDAGYWAGDYWNGDIGHTLPFFTDAAVGTSLAFYSLLLDTDGNTVNTSLLANVWTLAANGTLTFSGGAPVPLPAALWLMFGALASAFGLSRKARG